MSFIIDRTERQQAETALKVALAQEKELGELKSRFVSMASHEFRTPLAAILATTETLTFYREKMNTAQIDSRLDKIRQQVVHMKNIMEDVLQLARIQAGRVEFAPTQGELAQLCQEIVEEFESQAPNRGRINCTCQMPTLLVDFDVRLMRQVISNLISNALKYSPQEQTIQIDLRQQEEQVVFQVTDRGIGIPAADLPRLFEPFHRAANVGVEVRANPKHATTPFIFLTAAADRDSLRKEMSLGADDYLTKPFTLDEVLGAIRTRLQRHAAQTQQGQHHIDVLSSALSQERKQNLLKSRLIALFSHDFRNPLSTILMSSSVIRNYADRLPPVRKQQALNRIDGAVHSLTQMLDDTLIIAELESGYLAYKPEPIALAPFIEAIVAEYRLIDQNAHKLTFQHELQRPTEVDPKLLRQLLSNLIANALNYSPAGSEVTIELPLLAK